MAEQNQTRERIANMVLRDCFTEKQLSLVERLSKSSYLQGIVIDFVDADINHPRIYLTAKVKQEWGSIGDFVSALTHEGNGHPTEAEEFADGYRLIYNLAAYYEKDQKIRLYCLKKRIDKRFSYYLRPPAEGE